MGLHSEVDFRGTVDTGESEAAAIVPYDDGEPANQAILRRPVENNRARTDVLRALARQHLVLADFDRAYQLHYIGPLTFDGAKPTYGGTFTTTAFDFYIWPFATPGNDALAAPYIESTKATLQVDDGGGNGILFTSKYKQWEAPAPATDPMIAQEANMISVEIKDTGSLTVDVEGATGQENNIVIGIDYGTTTISAVIAAVIADADASALVVPTLVGSGAIACPKFSDAEWAGDYTERFLRGGAAGVSHYITPANFAAFFSAHAENPMRKGDTIAIWYDKLIDLESTNAQDGRFQSTQANANQSIPATALFNTRREPEKIPNCIPICKCMDDDNIIFANGAYISRTQPAWLFFDSTAKVLSETGTLSTPLGWSRLHNGPTWNPPIQIRHALDNADGRLNEVMTEVEAGRDSTVFGTKSTLDQRLEAVDTHSRAFVSVTDGTTSTGGMYNGVGALQSAITALEAGVGGRILIRAGTYDITTAQSITKKIDIIGVEEDVIIRNRQSAAEAITYATTGAEGSRIEGVRFVQGSGGGLLTLKFTSVPFMRVLGVRCQGRATFDGCLGGVVDGGVYESLPADTRGVVIGNVSTNFQIRGVTFLTNFTSTGNVMLEVQAALGVRIEDCEFSLSSFNTNTALSALGGGLIVENCRFEMSFSISSASGIPVVKIDPGTSNQYNGCKLRDLVFWTGSGAAWPIKSSVLYIEGWDVEVDNVDIDLNQNTLDFTVGNEPVHFIGTGTIRNLRFHNCYVPDAGNWAPNPVLDHLTPVIRIEGSQNTVGELGIAVLRDSHIYDLINMAGASGVSPILILGGYSSSGGGNWIVDNLSGSQHFLHNKIDALQMGYLAPVGSPRNAIMNIQPGSIIDDNEVWCGNGEYGFAAIQVNDSGNPSVKVRRNHSYAHYYSNAVGFIIYRHETRPCTTGGEVIGNCVTLDGGKTAIITDVMFIGHAGGAQPTRGMRILDNAVLLYSTGLVSGGGIVRLMNVANVQSGTLTGNVLDRNTAGAGWFGFVDGGGNTTFPAAASFATENQDLP